MSDAAMNETDILSRMDDSKITKQHWKIMFISGMGFFTDAYDLFIIGVVISILKDEWHPSPWAVGLVTSTALLAAAFGAVIFGRVADMLGRKRIYGYEVLVLAAGAIASAFSSDIWWLIGFRIILGIGIGGDYPVSATLMSEFSGKKHRGMMVSLVFAMQAAGLIVGPLLAVAFLASGLPKDLVWRLLLAFGAIPAPRWQCSTCGGIWWRARAISSRPVNMMMLTRQPATCSVRAAAPPGTARRPRKPPSPKALWR
jgi:PHS family inorganic phosphate transporter-like MFS transporter